MTDTPFAHHHQSATSALVEVEWLFLQPPVLLAQGASGRPAAIRVVDLRWSPKGPSGAERYRAGHLPHALLVDLERDLSQPGGPGRHPFPPPERFADLLGRLGIGNETRVVVYDEGAGAVAARLWFMLRVHGHEPASVLDGGFAAWRAAGHPISTEEERPQPVAPPSLHLDRSRLLDRAQVKALLLRRSAGGPGPLPLLLDARSRERYRGDVEPLDPRKGHIPGAVNAPYEENLVSAADPRFRRHEELRGLYQKLGAASASEVAVSCGSGVTACHDALALELAGLGLPRLYVGSFSEWSRLPDEPVATGPEPGLLSS